MKYLPFLFIASLFFSCGQKPPPKKKVHLTQEQMNNLSVQMNTWSDKRENDEINQYIKAHGYTNMKTTASGLRYMLLKAGNGPLAQTGMTAKVNYKIYLLDGTICYTSDEKGPKEFEIGKANVEAGLHEGLQLMHVGDKMLFIMPSSLAQGFIGDESKIPPLSSVVYEIELIGLK